MNLPTTDITFHRVVRFHSKVSHYVKQGMEIHLDGRYTYLVVKDKLVAIHLGHTDCMGHVNWNAVGVVKDVNLQEITMPQLCQIIQNGKTIELERPVETDWDEDEYLSSDELSDAVNKNWGF